MQVPDLKINDFSNREYKSGLLLKLSWSAKS